MGGIRAAVKGPVPENLFRRMEDRVQLDDSAVRRGLSVISREISQVEPRNSEMQICQEPRQAISLPLLCFLGLWFSCLFRVAPLDTNGTGLCLRGCQAQLFALPLLAGASRLVEVGSRMTSAGFSVFVFLPRGSLST